jgi:hypothetical protein
VGLLRGGTISVLPSGFGGIYCVNLELGTLL